MNKKFLSAILFGALMVFSTGTFVSCSDYDDDIDRIDSELADIKTQLASLQSQINSGKYVTNVAKNGNGITITWNDGSSSTIETIKGDKGDKGDAVVITIDPVTKNWLIDGVDTGVCSEGKDGADGKDGVDGADGKDGVDGTDGKDGADGKDGKDGKDAPTPIFTVGEDGHIYVQLGEDGEKQDLGVCTGGIFYVDNGASYKLHVCDAEGNWNDILMPKTATISTIDVLAGTYWQWDDYSAASVDLVFGQNTTGAAVTFNGKTYANGALMSNAEAYAIAQVNPTMADATLYDFYLTDSKGNSIFELGTPSAYMTEGPITRAATANKGMYVFPVSFKAGTTVNAIVQRDQNIVYAIATKDIYGNEILSRYNLKVYTYTGTSALSINTTYKEVEVNKDFNLNTLVGKSNVIDTRYYFATAQTAAVNAAGASINGSNIKGSVVGKSVDVTVEYLKNDGTKATAGTITVKFIAPSTQNSFTQTITPKNDPTKDIVKFDLTSIFGNTVASPSYTVGAVKFAAAATDKNTTPATAIAAGTVSPAFGAGVASATQANTGYYKHEVAFPVTASTVIPGTYTAEVTYGSSPVNKITLTIVVEDPSTTFEFKPLSLYFAGNNATAYGTPNGAGQIAYNLTGLFGNNDWTNVKFTETKPASYRDANNVLWSANNWLVSGGTFGDILVDRVAAAGNFGGAYEARALKATYTPYANNNFNKVTYDFNLTIKSSVYEGTLIYRLRGAAKYNAQNQFIGYNYTTGAAKTINVASTTNYVMLNADEILGTTTTNVTYTGVGNAAIIQNIKVELLKNDIAEQYLEAVTGDATNGWKIQVKANVTAPAGQSVTCKVRVSVLDEWGKTKTVDVPVTLK